MRIPTETTPKVITDTIRNAASSLASGSEIITVKVSTEKAMKKKECFLNVQTVVSKEGGSCITGWAIWQWANIFIEFEAHAVWETPSSELIDVTRHEGETAILFLPDPSVQYEGYKIPSRRFALTSSSLVAELIELLSIKEADTFNSQINAVAYNYCKVGRILSRLGEIYHLLEAEVERNDPCPCQSGLKFKRCCGRGV